MFRPTERGAHKCELRLAILCVENAKRHAIRIHWGICLPNASRTAGYVGTEGSASTRMASTDWSRLVIESPSRNSYSHLCKAHQRYRRKVSGGFKRRKPSVHAKTFARKPPESRSPYFAAVIVPHTARRGAVEPICRTTITATYSVVVRTGGSDCNSSGGSVGC